jgi:hypothetical protein
MPQSPFKARVTENIDVRTQTANNVGPEAAVPLSPGNKLAKEQLALLMGKSMNKEKQAGAAKKMHRALYGKKPSLKRDVATHAGISSLLSAPMGKHYAAAGAVEGGLVGAISHAVKKSRYNKRKKGVNKALALGGGLAGATGIAAGSGAGYAAGKSKKASVKDKFMNYVSTMSGKAGKESAERAAKMSGKAQKADDLASLPMTSRSQKAHHGEVSSAYRKGVLAENKVGDKANKATRNARLGTGAAIAGAGAAALGARALHKSLKARKLAKRNKGLGMLAGAAGVGAIGGAALSR